MDSAILAYVAGIRKSDMTAPRSCRALSQLLLLRTPDDRGDGGTEGSG